MFIAFWKRLEGELRPLIICCFHFVKLIWRYIFLGDHLNLWLFLCPGLHTCFVCKKRGEDVRRCMIPVCGKFYHGECIANYAPTVPVNRGFRCSIHVCLTCFIANPNSSNISKGNQRTLRPHLRCNHPSCAVAFTLLFTSTGRLVRCVRCPVAYHATDLCMAAGSVVLSNNSIVCPNHFTPRRGVKNHEHVNVSWCFVCTEGTDAKGNSRPD